VLEGQSAFGDSSGGRLSKAMQNAMGDAPFGIQALVTAFQNMGEIAGQQTALYSNALCGAMPPQAENKKVRVEGKMNSFSRFLIKMALMLSLAAPTAKAFATVEILKNLFPESGAGQARLILYGENCDGRTFSLFGTKNPNAVVAPLTQGIYGCGLGIGNGVLTVGRSGAMPPKV